VLIREDYIKCFWRTSGFSSPTSQTTREKAWWIPRPGSLFVLTFFLYQCNSSKLTYKLNSSKERGMSYISQRKNLIKCPIRN